MKPFINCCPVSAEPVLGFACRGRSAFRVLLTSLLVVVLSSVGLGAQAQSVDASAVLRIQDRVSVTGVTAYDLNHLWAFVIQRVATNQDPAANVSDLSLDEIARSIQQLYREDGYFLATATPRVRADSASIEVHEGHITTVEVRGASTDLAKAIHDLVLTAAGDGPIKLERFERGLMLAKDLAGVSLTSEFMSSNGTNDDLLKISVTEVKRRGGITVDNLPRNFGKSIFAALTQEFYSTLAPGDMLRVNVLPSADFHGEWRAVYGGLQYRAPIGSQGWYAEGSIGKGFTRNLFISANQSPQELFQRTLNASVVLGYPLMRDVHGFAVWLSEVGHTRLDNSIVGLDDTRTRFLRQFFVYSNHADDGSSFHASLALTGGSADRQFYLNQAISDSGFFHARLGIGRIVPLDQQSAGLGLRLEATLQLSASSLPSTEKFFLGDRSRLRGYGYSELVGDSGIAATVELGHFHAVGVRYLASVTPFAFLDAGWIKQNTPISGRLNETPLASVGIGVQTRSQEGFSIRSWVGVPLIAGQVTRARSPALWMQFAQTW